VAIDVDELATALRDAMPRTSEVVDRYHRFGESELAIPAALAVFAQENVPLPAGLPPGRGAGQRTRHLAQIRSEYPQRARGHPDQDVRIAAPSSTKHRQLNSRLSQA
jgi:hypothetical protein